MGINHMGLTTSTGRAVSTNVGTLLVNQNTSIPTDIYITWLTEMGGTRNWVFSMEAWGIKRGTSENVKIGQGWTGDGGLNLTSTNEPSGYRYELGLKDAFRACGMGEVNMIGWYTVQYDQIHFGITIKPADFPDAKVTKQFNVCYYPLATGGNQIGTYDSSHVGMSISIPTQWRNGNLTAMLYSLKDTNGTERCRNGNGVPMSVRFSSGSVYCIVPVGGNGIANPVLTNGRNATAVIGLSGPGTATSLVQRATVTFTAADQNLGTLTLSAVRNQANGAVTVTASHNTSLAVNSYTFSINGSTLKCDTITTPSSSVTFPMAPAGQFVVTCRATNTTLNAVATATTTVPPWKGASSNGGIFKLARLDGTGDAFVAMFNLKLSESGEPDKQTYRLAGRPRPSAFYGEGGTRKFTVSWDVLPDGTMPSLGTMNAQFEALRLMGQGDCIADLPNGERLQVTVGHPQIARGFDIIGASVSIELQEVR